MIFFKWAQKFFAKIVGENYKIVICQGGHQIISQWFWNNGIVECAGWLKTKKFQGAKKIYLLKYFLLDFVIVCFSVFLLVLQNGVLVCKLHLSFLILLKQKLFFLHLTLFPFLLLVFVLTEPCQFLLPSRP